MHWLVLRWGKSKQAIFDRVERGLAELGHTYDAYDRGEMDQRDELLDLIRSRSHDAILTWQRIYPNQPRLIDAVRNAGVRRVTMDFGFWPHYESVVFDGRGENFESEFRESWANGGPRHSVADAEIDRVIREALDDAHTGGAAEPRPLRNLPRPFVFLPLQRPGDSVVRFDSDVHDFGELVRRVLFLARGRYFVVVKVHPLDRDLDLGVPDEIPGVLKVIRAGFSRHNERMNALLLSRAALVVGINSNMLFRAMLYDTPVIALGRGWFTGSGAVCEVDGLESLRDLSAPHVGRRIRRRYIGACLGRQIVFDGLDRPEHLHRVLSQLGVGPRTVKAIQHA